MSATWRLGHYFEVVFDAICFYIVDQLKKQIEDCYPGLVKEFPGSKWPKTSVACLRDNKRLSREDLEILRDICR